MKRLFILLSTVSFVSGTASIDLSSVDDLNDQFARLTVEENAKILQYDTDTEYKKHQSVHERFF